MYTEQYFLLIWLFLCCIKRLRRVTMFTFTYFTIIFWFQFTDPNNIIQSHISRLAYDLRVYVITYECLPIMSAILNMNQTSRSNRTVCAQRAHSPIMTTVLVTIHLKKVKLCANCIPEHNNKLSFKMPQIGRNVHLMSTVAEDNRILSNSTKVKYFYRKLNNFTSKGNTQS